MTSKPSPQSPLLFKVVPVYRLGTYRLKKEHSNLVLPHKQELVTKILGIFSTIWNIVTGLHKKIAFRNSRFSALTLSLALAERSCGQWAVAESAGNCRLGGFFLSDHTEST